MVIGITGGIGSGKTTFSKMLHTNSHNTILLLTDEIAKEQQKIGKESYLSIVSHFGNEILNEDMTINSKRLGEIVFSNKEKLELLNSITHPNVIKFVKDTISSNPNVHILVESAILFDCVDLVNLCDYTILVNTSLERRIDWLKNNRGYSMEKIEDILSKQKDYTGMASFVVDNNLDKENLDYESIKLAKLLGL